MRGKVWRIGLMGESAREANVFALLSALETVLSSLGYEVAFGASLASAPEGPSPPTPPLADPSSSFAA